MTDAAPVVKPQVIIATRIKDILHEVEVNSSSDFLEAFNDAVIEMAKKVGQRVKGNGRKTARPCDI
jgi:nitrate/TMAO reductase-like tetraheme cytochrome c subunit